MDHLVLNLDTNHVSELARRSSEAGAPEVLRILQRDEARLSLSIFHLVELSAPGFRSVNEVRALLRDVPALFSNPFQEVFDEEVAGACARATGRTRRPPRVFAESTADWGYHGGPVGGTPLDMLDGVSGAPETRQRLLQFADAAALESMMKERAALVRTPDVPLRLLVERHLTDRRTRMFDYADGLTAEEVIERAGGVAAFPAVEAYEGIMRQRLMLRGQKSTRNDLFDEQIALYAPYAAVTASDGGTVARARAAKVGAAVRIVRSLSDVPGILQRIHAGELAIVPSA